MDSHVSWITLIVPVLVASPFSSFIVVVVNAITASNIINQCRRSIIHVICAATP